MRGSSRKFLALLVTVLLVSTLRAEDARVDLAREMGVTLRLAGEEEPLACELVAWDRAQVWVRVAGPESEREIRWSEIQPAQAFDIARRLIDNRSSGDWVWLGLLMLEARNEALAKRAFDVAVRLAPELKASVASAMALHAAGNDPAPAFAPKPDEGSSEPPAESEKDEGAPSNPRRGVIPDGQARRVTGWPLLTAQQQQEHTLAVRRACEDYLAKASMKLSPVETARFLFYSELSPAETRRWAGELDRMYSTLLTTLEIPAGTELFQGKCAVFVFREREKFIEFERHAFATDAAKFAGVNHQRSGYAFTVFFKGADDKEFNSTLIHETVHAFMYRYRSPAPLPTWANEGLADFVAGHLVAYSAEPRNHWSHARNYIAAKKSVLEIMSQSYAVGSWPTDDSYPVSHMLVRFLLKNKPREFKLWIDDIKAGSDWREALRGRFGVTPEVLAEGFGADMLREPGYSPLR